MVSCVASHKPYLPKDLNNYCLYVVLTLPCIVIIVLGGGASFLYKLGADPILIKLSGDWLSDSYLRYVSVDLEHFMIVQQIIAAAIAP